MQTTIKVFASLRALAGADEVTVELEPGASVADALTQLAWVDEETAMVVAVNREYADRSTRIYPGDEVALIPPVSGGAEPGRPDDLGHPAEPGRPEEPGDLETTRAQDRSAPTRVSVTVAEQEIDERELTAQVSDPGAGAIVTFMGVTRDVPALEYEAYTEMATAEIEQIARTAGARHRLIAVAVSHRFGTVKREAASVVIAVSAPHRAAAFAGAREVIDEIKLRAPIWKREQGEWATGHLPSPTR